MGLGKPNQSLKHIGLQVADRFVAVVVDGNGDSKSVEVGIDAITDVLRLGNITPIIPLFWTTHCPIRVMIL